MGMSLAMLLSFQLTILKPVEKSSVENPIPLFVEMYQGNRH
jgi:hypothetical protein